jgi:hypothetical protein
MQPLVNSYTSWQPLEEVIVGRTFTPEHFEFIQDKQVFNQLSQILSETAEDLDNLQKTIEQYGATVRRPDLPDVKQFHQSQINSQWAPLPPLTPRDWQITLGDKLLRVLPIPELNKICKDYGDQVINPHGDHWDENCILNGASASCIVRVGRDVFFDNSDYLKPEQTRWIVDNVLGPDYRIHEAVTDGHGDAVFAILKPGVILSSKHDENLNFERDFPGWDVCKIWDSSIWAAMEVGKFKEDNFNGRWYVQGQNPTDEFTAYVDKYLKNWVGFVSETVFDVNCLVLDEENVIFSAYNKQVFDFCKKHKINPIISELRHSYFWDGGASCCTQDIRRRGGLETYL